MKKGFAVATTLLLLISALLAACSGNNQKGSQATGKSDDNGGSQEKLAITVMRHEHPSVALNPKAPALQEIEKVTGVKIDLQGVPHSDWETKKRTLISTNRVPDVMNVFLKDLQDYAETGIFLDLTPYLDKMPNLKKAMAEYPDLDKQLINGKRYGLPLLDRVPLNYAQSPMIRVDILKKLNLPTPASFNELHETLKKMKEADPNSYPWTMRWGIMSQLPYLSYAFGSGYPTYYEPTANRYQFGPLYPEFKSLIEYVKTLYDEKLLDPNYAINTPEQWQENLSSGKSLFSYDNMKFSVNFNLALQKNDPEAMFDMLPVLANDNGQQRARKYQDGHQTEFYAISSKVKNPEKVLAFMDWMYSEEGADITNYGVPGVHFTRTNGGVKIDEQLVEEYKKNNDPTRAIQSYLGTGYLAFNLYSDETFFFLMSPPIMSEWNDKVKKQYEEGLLQEYITDPLFNAEEIEKLKVIDTKVKTIVEQNLDKFIMGARPMSDWDQFVQELNDAGAKEVEQIYNDANDRVMS